MQNIPTRVSLLFLALASSLPLVAGNQYSVVANATSSGANGALGPWVFSGGLLYGTSSFGGAGSNGTLFSFDPTNNQYTLIHSFDGANEGLSPNGLIEASNGRLYGTSNAGMHVWGTLFASNKTGSFFETLHQFNVVAGVGSGNPEGPPLSGSDDKIYGVFSDGGDNLFGGFYRIDQNGANYTVLRSFTGTGGATRGKGIDCGGLVEGPGGFLYGATPRGGSDDNGVFFQMSKDGASYSNFREWPATGLRRPDSKLILASDDNFYGTASIGGAANKGGIYRISPTGDYKELHEFTDSPDGFVAFSELLEGSDGYLYGSAFNSSNFKGSLFRLGKDGSSFAVLHRFAGGTEDGSNPASPLLETQNGVFFGTSSAGGANSAGVLFRLASTVEAPKLKVRGSLRPKFRGRTLRLRGTATDDLQLVRVEYTTKKAFRPTRGTSTWSARIPVKPSAKRVTVRVRARDNDARFSRFAIIRARRAE